MVQQTRAYRDRSREYLAKAFRELEDGDLTQASEKGWGAAAQMVKAVADERGMDHHYHAAVFRAAQVHWREKSTTTIRKYNSPWPAICTATSTRKRLTAKVWNYASSR